MFTNFPGVETRPSAPNPLGTWNVRPPRALWPSPFVFCGCPGGGHWREVGDLSIVRVVGGTCGHCVVQQVVIPHAFVERPFSFLASSAPGLSLASVYCGICAHTQHEFAHESR